MKKILLPILFFSLQLFAMDFTLCSETNSGDNKNHQNGVLVSTTQQWPRAFDKPCDDCTRLTAIINNNGEIRLIAHGKNKTKFKSNEGISLISLLDDLIKSKIIDKKTKKDVESFAPQVKSTSVRPVHIGICVINNNTTGAKVWSITFQVVRKKDIGNDFSSTYNITISNDILIHEFKKKLSSRVTSQREIL